MEINALLMGLTDNVATCITDIVKGDTVTYHDKRMNVFLNHTHLSSKIIKT